jgi:hypothetical protein
VNRDDIIRLAADAGITPWVHHQWVKDKFIHIDEGMDGDLACLMQFANLVAAAQRQPLTDEQISALWHQSGEQPFKFARMLLK